MDLIDLFIGSEGTLGFIVEATLRVRSVRPATCMAFVAVPDWERALALVTRLRTAAKETWHSSDQNGLDVSAIEHVDRRCLEIAQQDGLDAKTGLTWPARTACALIVTLELPAGTTAEQVYADIFRMDEGSNTPALGRFAGVVDDIGVLEQTLIATPGDSRMARIVAFREEVPASVNQRVGRSKMQDERIEKTAGDMIVPFDRLGELMALYDEHFRRAGLDVAVWGHISDGNLHPNVLPRTYADVERGREALIEIGREVIRMGGSPLAEHGVGRSALKQQFLRELYGDEGIEQMRRVKRALDPEWKLSPGVLFPR
jgi:D-lactate dehydrogenase (cytochrome)